MVKKEMRTAVSVRSLWLPSPSSCQCQCQCQSSSAQCSPPLLQRQRPPRPLAHVCLPKAGYTETLFPTSSGFGSLIRLSKVQQGSYDLTCPFLSPSPSLHHERPTVNISLPVPLNLVLGHIGIRCRQSRLRFTPSSFPQIRVRRFPLCPQCWLITKVELEWSPHFILVKHHPRRG